MTAPLSASAERTSDPQPHNPVHVRRSWKAALASDAEALAFAHCWEAAQPSAAMLTVHPKALSGAAVYLRPGTTDAQVLDDTFIGLYHLPPKDLPAQPTVLDLGGNIGLTAAHFLTMRPGARVVCVEMDAANAQQARLNTAEIAEQTGGRCEVIHAAAAAHDGFMQYAGTEAWGYRLTALDQHPSTSASNRTVRAISMARLFAETSLSNVDYCKIDIEGAEAMILTREATWLEQVQMIKVEHHLPATFNSIADVLTKFGFRVSADKTHPRCVVGTRT